MIMQPRYNLSLFHQRDLTCHIRDFYRNYYKWAFISYYIYVIQSSSTLAPSVHKINNVHQYCIWYYLISKVSKWTIKRVHHTHSWILSMSLCVREAKMIICDTAKMQGFSDNTGTQCASWRGHSEASAHYGQLQNWLCVSTETEREWERHSLVK